ncbi:hypothetical protein [Vibrio cincinnatiensis]|uniref:hypothetical protein n=1 Tax=Vibrio cincinnatiensis TaxID=675 RepID=UPI001EDD53C4|nr:hypothetical protein [Vibrio cincinnatiensis]MCG3732825.1 hypothetical protein [Vibrio cincinnatiensis]MCG3735635.1 hypothetical protein [Vibrio cincinnatiensis]MCG3739050.1 hypothetical protein [Vibrio cincinnatiensis]MCG3741894.1 hypothetical protein [Vibrio cincinnatiensis]MCG3745603.1 hypothetical protein [Vibrio cincinnatiensis]
MQTLIKLVFAALALLAGWYASDLIKHWQTHTPPQEVHHYCPLSTQTCQQQGVSMTLTQDIVQPLAATTLMVEWPNAQSQQLTLTLQGLEMEMGTVKFLLTKKAEGSFSGELMLPVCTLQGMTWIGMLTDGHASVYLSVRMEK